MPNNTVNKKRGTKRTEGFDQGMTVDSTQIIEHMKRSNHNSNTLHMLLVSNKQNTQNLISPAKNSIETTKRRQSKEKSLSCKKTKSSKAQKQQQLFQPSDIFIQRDDSLESFAKLAKTQVQVLANDRKYSRPTATGVTTVKQDTAAWSDAFLTASQKIIHDCQSEEKPTINKSKVQRTQRQIPEFNKETQMDLDAVFTKMDFDGTHSKQQKHQRDRSNERDTSRSQYSNGKKGGPDNLAQTQINVFSINKIPTPKLTSKLNSRDTQKLSKTKQGSLVKHVHKVTDPKDTGRRQPKTDLDSYMDIIGQQYGMRQQDQQQMKKGSSVSKVDVSQKAAMVVSSNSPAYITKDALTESIGQYQNKLEGSSESRQVVRAATLSRLRSHAQNQQSSAERVMHYAEGDSQLLAQKKLKLSESRKSFRPTDNVQIFSVVGTQNAILPSIKKDDLFKTQIAKRSKRGQF